MAEHILRTLKPTSRILKRAQYEAFEFTLTPSGVRVRNGSHADPENHEYLVRIVGGVPTHCTCPADAKYEGPCKHRVAVAIRTPVLTAASKSPRSDGGAVDDSDDEQTCDCESLSDGFPCWECVRAGRRELP